MPHAQEKFAFLVWAVLWPGIAFSMPEEEPRPLLERLKDEHARGSDLWIYNDIGEARNEARRTNKPLFVTFRCVPCKACAGFDADVAKGSELIAELARKKFVAVRQVEMKGVDLSQFQFDYDLNWAAMFLNADGTVYARYGTQSAAGPDAYNSIQGLLETMERVLELHAAYPGNRADLADKRGPKKPYATALDKPGLRNREKLRGETSRGNCIHCHNLHDAEHFDAQERGTFSFDMLWRYPLPENLGLVIDRDDGTLVKRVEPDSAAARAGMKEGQRVSHVQGQVITSIADIQWALHHLPNTSTTVRVRTRDGSDHALRMAPGWKKTDISWRGSMWSVSPRLRVWAPALSASESRELGIPEGQTALNVRWINTETPGGRSARDSGLRQGDVIVALEGKPMTLDNKQFNIHIKLNYRVGDEVPIVVLRDGKRRELKIRLAE